MIVAQGELFAALVHKVEDELLVLSVLAGEDLLAFEHGRVQLAPAKRREDVLDDPLDVLPAEHLARAVVACALHVVPSAKEQKRSLAMSLSPGTHTAMQSRTLGVLSSIRSFFFSPLPPPFAAFCASASVRFKSPSFFFASSTVAASACCFRKSFTSALCAATSAASASGFGLDVLAIVLLVAVVLMPWVIGMDVSRDRSNLEDR